MFVCSRALYTFFTNMDTTKQNTKHVTSQTKHKEKHPITLNQRLSNIEMRLGKLERALNVVLEEAEKNLPPVVDNTASLLESKEFAETVANTAVSSPGISIRPGLFEPDDYISVSSIIGERFEVPGQVIADSHKYFREGQQNQNPLVMAGFPIVTRFLDDNQEQVVTMGMVWRTTAPLVYDFGKVPVENYIKYSRIQYDDERHIYFGCSFPIDASFYRLVAATFATMTNSISGFMFTIISQIEFAQSSWQLALRAVGAGLATNHLLTGAIIATSIDEAMTFLPAELDLKWKYADKNRKLLISAGLSNDVMKTYKQQGIVARCGAYQRGSFYNSQGDRFTLDIAPNMDAVVGLILMQSKVTAKIDVASFADGVPGHKLKKDESAEIESAWADLNQQIAELADMGGGLDKVAGDMVNQVLGYYDKEGVKKSVPKIERDIRTIKAAKNSRLERMKAEVERKKRQEAAAAKKGMKTKMTNDERSKMQQTTRARLAQKRKAPVGFKVLNQELEEAMLAAKDEPV